MLKLSMIFALTFTAIQWALAHGEDVPGPHGGHIRMPANFHTEVLSGGKNTFQIYLLDMEFKNPSVTNSSVQAQLIQKNKTTELTCAAKDDHFECKSEVTIKTGTLVIKPNRLGTLASMEAKYSLPLKKFKANRDGRKP